ncbi:hypothetical protein Ciccas_002440 [Cichlidogyrus casuarinus]|uniref:Exoribonuclease phosphorolytic domain-containing protein n=1 Tax=Cichlidogyrus casuarinus TaxID=1844966 RepID=A0ABD2QH93_9PLAT
MDGLYLQLATDSNALGSSTWELQNDHIVCSIFGPDECNNNDELIHRARICVKITASSVFPNNKLFIVEKFLENLIESVLDVREFPHLKLSFEIQVVSGITDSASCVAAMVNALTLALLQSFIPIHATPASVSIDLFGKEVAIIVDLAHPSFSSSLKYSKNLCETNAIIGTYFDRSKSIISQPIDYHQLHSLYDLLQKDPSSFQGKTTPISEAAEFCRNRIISINDLILNKFTPSL